MAILILGCSSGSGSFGNSGTNISRVADTISGRPDHLVPANIDYFLGTWEGNVVFCITNGSTNTAWPWNGNYYVATNGTLISRNDAATIFHRDAKVEMNVAMGVDSAGNTRYNLTVNDITGNPFTAGPYYTDTTAGNMGTVAFNTVSTSNIENFYYAIRCAQVFGYSESKRIDVGSYVAATNTFASSTDVFSLYSSTAGYTNSGLMALSSIVAGATNATAPAVTNTFIVRGMDSNLNALTDVTNVNFFAGFFYIGTYDSATATGTASYMIKIGD